MKIHDFAPADEEKTEQNRRNPEMFVRLRKKKKTGKKRNP